MKRIGCLCLAAAVLLSVTACGGSASSVSSSVPEVSSSSAETAEVSAVDFYDAFDEIIQDGEYGMHAKGITDNAKKFIADHDELFSQNKPLSGDDLGLLQENMDLRSVIKNQEKAGNALFNETGMVATVYKGNIIKNLIMDCQSYTKYRPNETTGGIFVSWRRKEELPTGA